MNKLGLFLETKGEKRYFWINTAHFRRIKYYTSGTTAPKDQSLIYEGGNSCRLLLLTADNKPSLLFIFLGFSSLLPHVTVATRPLAFAAWRTPAARSPRSSARGSLTEGMCVCTWTSSSCCSWPMRPRRSPAW